MNLHVASFLWNTGKQCRIQIRRHKTRRLIRIYIVCLQNVLFEYEKLEKESPKQPLNWKWTRSFDMGEIQFYLNGLSFLGFSKMKVIFYYSRWTV